MHVKLCINACEWNCHVRKWVQIIINLHSLIKVISITLIVMYLPENVAKIQN